MKKVVCLVLGFLMVMSLFSVFSASGAEKVTLRMWATASTSRDVARAIIWKDFEAKHPGVKVDFEGIPWGAFMEKILTSAIAGTLPDACRYSFAPQFASKGLLMPLIQFIEGENGIDTDKYMDGVFPNPCITLGGEIYALPFAYEGYPSFFYNKDIFEAEGVTPPTTWAELRAVAEKCTKKDADGEITQDGIVFMVCGPFVDGFLSTSGAQTTDVIGEGATKATFSAPGNVAGLNFLIDLLNDGYLRGGDWGACTKNFVEGRMGIFLNMGSWACDFRPEIYPDFNWGTMVPPALEGQPQVNPANFSDAGFIFASTEHPELAWELLKAYAYDGSPFIWSKKYGSLPPFKDLLTGTTNPYYAFYQVEPKLREMVEVAASAPSVLPTPQLWHAKGAEVEALTNGIYGLVFEGKMSVEEALAALDGKVDILLSE